MEIQQLKQMIRDTGLKCTSTRLAVLQFLVDIHRPVSIQEVIQNLKDTSINEVTVYRILDSFVEKKLVQQVDHWDRHRLYEAHLEEGCQSNHAHFSCRECGQVLCLEDSGSWQLATVVLPPGYVANQIRFQIEGICPQCNH